MCCGINGACKMREFRVANISNFHCGQSQFSLRQTHPHTCLEIYITFCSICEYTYTHSHVE